MTAPEILKMYVPHRQLEELLATRKEYFVREAAWWLKNQVASAPCFDGIGFGDPAAPYCLRYFTDRFDIRITQLNHLDRRGYGYKSDLEKGRLSFHVFNIHKIVKHDFIQTSFCVDTSCLS